jgi:hypothetical protein
MFLYRVNTGDIGIPDDGYGWMDDEVFSKATVANQVIYFYFLLLFILSFDS